MEGSGPRKWGRDRTAYRCVDGVCVAARRPLASAKKNGEKKSPGSGILYGKDAPPSVLVSETELGRDLGSVEEGARGARTFAMPRTVEVVRDKAFC